MEDEIKIVNCGCGGNGKILKINENSFFITCSKCHTDSGIYSTEVEAITAWNKAMDGAKDINVPDKFVTDINVGNKEQTAKVTKYSFIYGFDGQCKCGKRVDAHWNYCPSCGARLEWK